MPNCLVEDLSLSFFLNHNSLKLVDGIEIKNGRLNSISLYQNPLGELICVRKVESNNRSFVGEYLEEIHEALGFKRFGGSIHFNSILEQTQRMDSLRSKGVSVPNVIKFGSNWIAMAYIEGITLAEALSRNFSPHTFENIKNYLNAVLISHSRGGLLWDRSGSNEIIQASGHVSFIDFDIDIQFPACISSDVIAAYDISTCIRTCLRFSQNKETAYRAIAQFFLRPEVKNVYDYAQLGEILTQQSNYYYQMQKHSEYGAFYKNESICNYYTRKIATDLSQPSYNLSEYFIPSLR